MAAASADARRTEGGAFDGQTAIPAPAPGMYAAIARFQVEPGKRLRLTVNIGIRDPLDSFTDSGIVRLIPGLAEGAAERIAAIGNRWEEIHGEKISRRIEWLAAAVQS